MAAGVTECLRVSDRRAAEAVTSTRDGAAGRWPTSEGEAAARVRVAVPVFVVVGGGRGVADGRARAGDGVARR